MIASTCHEASSAAAVDSPFLQVFSLGFVWVFLHCAPMCGPIISGLNLSRQMHPALALGFYQSGRAIMYAIFGGIAGYLGGSFWSSPYWGWCLIAMMGCLLAYQLMPQSFRKQSILPRWFMRIPQNISRFPGWARPFFFGVLFSFLPCMLTAWVLTLSASTHSAWQGALVMLCLILMTSFPLLGVTWGASRLFRGNSHWISTGLLGLSFVWTCLVTLAANKIISHYHIQFEIMTKTYTLMFW